MKRKAIIETVKRYANVDELVFDAVLLVLVAAFTRLSGERNLLSALHPVIMIALMLLMETLVPLYLALIYARFRDRASSGAWYRVLALTAAPAGIGASLVLCYYLPFAVSEYRGSGILAGFFFMNTVLGPLMVMGGWDMGTRIDAGMDRKASGLVTTALTVVNYAFMPLVVLFALVYGMMTESWAPPLAAGACYLATGLLAAAGKKIETVFARDAVKSFVIPGVLCALFSISMDFMNDLLPLHFRGHTALALVVSGILPVRLLLLACPPIKPVNLAVGIAALALLVAGWMTA